MDPSDIANAFLEQSTTPEALKADPGIGKVHTDAVGEDSGDREFLGDVATKD